MASDLRISCRLAIAFWFLLLVPRSIAFKFYSSVDKGKRNAKSIEHQAKKVLDEVADGFSRYLNY